MEAPLQDVEDHEGPHSDIESNSQEDNLVIDDDCNDSVLGDNSVRLNSFVDVINNPEFENQFSQEKTVAISVSNNQINSDGLTFICKDCNKSLTTAYYLKRHRQFSCRMLPQTRLQCSRCPNRYINASDLRFHVLSIHKINISLREANAYEKVVVHHENVPVSVCLSEEPSNKSGTSSASSSKEGFACKFCNKVLTAFTSLQRHVEYHCPRQQKTRLQCIQCSELFASHQFLQRHVLRVHNIKITFNESKNYPRVPINDDHSKFHRSSSRSLQNSVGSHGNSQLLEDVQEHVENGDSEAVSDDKRFNDGFVCKYCNKVLTTSHTLQRHVEYHCSSRPKYRLQCINCEKLFSSHQMLQRHVLVHHNIKITFNESKYYPKVPILDDTSTIDGSHLRLPPSNDGSPGVQQRVSQAQVTKQINRGNETASVGKRTSCSSINKRSKQQRISYTDVANQDGNGVPVSDACDNISRLQEIAREIASSFCTPRDKAVTSEQQTHILSSIEEQPTGNIEETTDVFDTTEHILPDLEELNEDSHQTVIKQEYEECVSSPESPQNVIIEAAAVYSDSDDSTDEMIPPKNLQSNISFGQNTTTLQRSPNGNPMPSSTELHSNSEKMQDINISKENTKSCSILNLDPVAESSRNFNVPCHSKKRYKKSRRFCVACNQTFSSTTTLKLHEEYHCPARKQRKRSRCIYCKTLVSSVNALIQHVLKVHNIKITPKEAKSFPKIMVKYSIASDREPNNGVDSVRTSSLPETAEFSENSKSSEYHEETKEVPKHFENKSTSDPNQVDSASSREVLEIIKSNETPYLNQNNTSMNGNCDSSEVDESSKNFVENNEAFWVKEQNNIDECLVTDSDTNDFMMCDPLQQDIKSELPVSSSEQT